MTTDTIQTEDYTTTTGRQMTLVHARRDTRRFTYEEPQWTEYWTYQDERGWWGSIQAQSREGAIVALEERQRLQAAEDDWTELTRSDYEDACQVWSIPVRPDDEIATSYGIRYGDFSMPHYTTETRIEMVLALRRQKALDQEAQERRESRPAPEIETATCLRCGNETGRALLMTSTIDGAVCPDCWHEVSDGEGFGL